MTKVNVNWWKPSGKWYASETLEIPDSVRPFDSTAVKRFIVENQTTLVPSWCGNYFVTLECSDASPHFFNRLYRPQDFTGYRKSGDA